jgi:hypothetical protein
VITWIGALSGAIAVIAAALISGWWQHGGTLAARRRKLAQELEMYHRVPEDQDEGQRYRRYVLSELSRYVDRSRRRTFLEWFIRCGWIPLAIMVVLNLLMSEGAVPSWGDSSTRTWRYFAYAYAVLLVAWGITRLSLVSRFAITRFFMGTWDDRRAALRRVQARANAAVERVGGLDEDERPPA